MTADRPNLPDEKTIAVAEALERASIPFALGGAITLVYWGEPRGTVDIDINIFLPISDADRVFDAVTDLGFDVDRESARATLRKDDQIRLDWDGTFVDLFFAFDPFHESCRERAVRVEFLGHVFPVLSAEDGVVFKVLFNRGKDWADIEQVIAMQGRRFDLAYARHWLARMLGGDDQRIARLEGLVAEYADEP